MRLASLALVLFFGSDLFAHKLLLEPKIEATRVRIEAFYDDDTPAQEASVRVTDEADEPVAEGKTDATGVWSFARPPAGTYTVKVSSSGHVGKKSLVVPETAKPIETQSTRAEQTQTPWLGVGLGLGVVLLLTLGWLAWRKKNAI